MEWKTALTATVQVITFEQTMRAFQFDVSRGCTLLNITRVTLAPPVSYHVDFGNTVANDDRAATTLKMSSDSPDRNNKEKFKKML